MLTRIQDFYEFFKIDERSRALGGNAALRAGEKAKGMTHLCDYQALAAIALHFKPRRIFEIGTYLGVTSDFFLALLPECTVVSIAYQNPRWHFVGKAFNNSELTRKQIGSEVSGERRSRFIQLYGDSHKLESQSILQEHRQFDLALIDGDHSAEGVFQDTELAKKIVVDTGVICWHDANPKPQYMDVRRFLEEKLALPAIATEDHHVGGIACWSREIEDRLKLDSQTGRQVAATDAGGGIRNFV